MKIFSNYLENKIRKANITYTYDEKSTSLIMEHKESGKIWRPMIQTGGKYKRGFWKIPN